MHLTDPSLLPLFPSLHPPYHPPTPSLLNPYPVPTSTQTLSLPLPLPLPSPSLNTPSFSLQLYPSHS